MANTPHGQRPAATGATAPARTPSASGPEPVAAFRFGGVSAAVFADEVTSGASKATTYHVSLGRSYHDAQGIWTTTHLLRPSDLLPASLALVRAYEFIAEARRPDAGDEE